MKSSTSRKEWQSVVVRKNDSIIDVINVIDAGAMAIALVVEDDGVLSGVVTDGDIRRALLARISLESAVHHIMNAVPTTLSVHATDQEALDLMQQKSLQHIPLIDAAGRVRHLKTLSTLRTAESHDNWVVLMAGGLGKRLRPLTENIPKPMLEIKGKPILAIIIESFIRSGFSKFYISINYKGDLIEEYFGDGSDFGITIKYLREDKRLGTAGALSLLPEIPLKPIIVMNGDLITNVSMSALLRFHEEHKAKATMCVREYDLQIPYGVVELKGNNVTGMKEKPKHTFFANAGIYVISPELLPDIPRNEYYDMDAFFKKNIDPSNSVFAFPLREYWLDIGRFEDFESAESAYETNIMESAPEFVE